MLAKWANMVRSEQDSAWLQPKEGTACRDTWQGGPLQLGAGMLQVKQATDVLVLR